MEQEQTPSVAAQDVEQPAEQAPAVAQSTPPVAAEGENVVATSQKQAEDVMQRAAAGEELTVEEKEALAAAEAIDEAGYEPFTYHNRTMYRVIESPTHTFSQEQDAIAFVTAMRLARNLNEQA